MCMCVSDLDARASSPAGTARAPGPPQRTGHSRVSVGLYSIFSRFILQHARRTRFDSSHARARQPTRAACGELGVHV